MAKGCADSACAQNPECMKANGSPCDCCPGNVVLSASDVNYCKCPYDGARTGYKKNLVYT